ncbi:MAG TPA: hypothetical protein VJV75_03390, partial [Candidatus Polarisedimenticolia bacterium]|nr:hypothetical protein [Candidatus Polarisedimenticolia bacterium]
VVFDKLANRWLISQFTTGAVGGTYFQCVAISTTADATGTYARYAFALPGGIFGDYPHFGVWTDAYYMMAHGFSSSGGTGSYVAGVFAAMDRAKLLAGDPTATWQVILDSEEGGHLPADLDGVTPPPTGAPGVFLSLHSNGMWFYRMKVDFAVPANTTRTLQGIAPVAPSTGACTFAATPGTCIPQPGSTRLLDSLGDRLMFRAAYRNFLDHESIVVSHSVDPSILGVVSGVRWYDFRLSGSPDATCTTFPCTWQQGTIGDIESGRSRWNPSIAMDGAENILVAYSTTGKVANTENHTIRYTGRAKNDPRNTMTVPEAIIATGIRNNTGSSRWGDYSSLSVDPFDDCTLWSVNQYYPATTAWSTRVASAVFPTGSGPGECQPTTCPTRPAAAPGVVGASVPGDNQIQVTWSPLVPTPGAYAIQRAGGACGSEGTYQALAVVPGDQTSYTDTTVQGGLNYSYRVVAASDAAGRCQGFVASACMGATATGTCNLKPAFAGALTATSRDTATCGVQLSWAPATSACPLTPTMRYNIFRGTAPDFTPSPANRIATCVPGPTSYIDGSVQASGVTYYYLVRAEDDSTINGGECGGGNEESNGIVVAGTAYGPGTQASPGTWADGGGDGTAFLRLNTRLTGETNDLAWRFIKTTTDPGANHTPGGAFAYRNAGPTPADVYTADTCSTLETPPLTVGATSVNLKFWEKHQIEYHWDGVVVEFNVNDSGWLGVAAPSNLPAEGCDPADVVTGWESFSCTGAPPANACGYETLDFGYNGPLATGTSCANWATSTTPTTYGHRCHAITGLSPSDTIKFRWRFTSDPGAEYSGFWLDDIAVTNVLLPNACVIDQCAGQPNGQGCSDGNACTTGEVCGGGVCGGGLPIVPTPLNDTIGFATDSTTLSWSDPPGNYNVYRGSFANGAAWSYNQTCLDPHTAASSTVDPAVPPLGSMFFYLVSRDTPCGESGLGSNSAGVPRPNPSPCP